MIPREFLFEFFVLEQTRPCRKDGARKEKRRRKMIFDGKNRIDSWLLWSSLPLLSEDKTHLRILGLFPATTVIFLICFRLEWPMHRPCRNINVPRDHHDLEEAVLGLEMKQMACSFDA